MLAIAALAFLCAGGQAQASTTLFNNTGTVCTVTDPCWEAGNFGVLVGLPAAVGTMSLSGNTSTVIDILGEVGVGAGSRISGGNTIATTGSNWSIIDFADPLATTTTGPLCPDSSNRCSVPTVASNDVRRVVIDTNTTRQMSSFVTAATADVLAMSNYWAGIGAGAYSGTVTNLTLNTAGTSTLGVAANGIANISVYNASTNLTSNRLLTIQGDINDLVILNFGSSRTATFNNISAIQLSGGITSDQVLINFTSADTSANALTISGGTVNGTFIVAGTNYRVTGTSNVNGRILGGSGTLTWGSNGSTVTLDAPNDIDPAGLPEPSTWILMGTGVAGLIYFGRRRQLAQRP